MNHYLWWVLTGFLYPVCFGVGYFYGLRRGWSDGLKFIEDFRRARRNDGA